VATSIIYNRVDYAGAMTDGRTVQEIDSKGKAASEIEQLWKYLFQQLSRSVAGAA
jgi:chromosome partitioning protein